MKGNNEPFTKYGQRAGSLSELNDQWYNSATIFFTLLKKVATDGAYDGTEELDTVVVKTPDNFSEYHSRSSKSNIKRMRSNGEMSSTMRLSCYLVMPSVLSAIIV